MWVALTATAAIFPEWATPQRYHNPPWF